MSERVYITAEGCEIEFDETREPWGAGSEVPRTYCRRQPAAARFPLSPDRLSYRELTFHPISTPQVGRVAGPCDAGLSDFELAGVPLLAVFEQWEA